MISPISGGRSGVVFQDFRLIPTMNVYDNVAFALRATNVSNKDIRQRVPYVLNLVGLQGKVRSMPEQLSGGEQQRVALARALVNNPDVILGGRAHRQYRPGTLL